MRPKVIMTDENALEALVTKEAPKGMKPGSHLTKLGKADRDYLRGMFNAFVEAVEPTIITGALTHKYRYTPREMWENIKRYFSVSIEYGQPLTVSGLAMFNGMKTKDLLIYHQEIPPEYMFLAYSVNFVEMYNEYAAHKKQNPAGPIFILKNFGWTDRIEVDHTGIPGAITQNERDEAQRRLKGFSEPIIIKEAEVESAPDTNV